MIMDAFSELGLERRLGISANAVREAYREKIRSAHPDAGGSAEQAQRLATAMAILESPGRRARHWLELQGMEVQGGIGGMDNDLADMFEPVATAIEKARTATAEVSATHSALGKAMAARKMLAARDQLESLLDTMAEMLAQAETQLAGMDQTGSAHAVAQMAHRLMFLEKWRAEMREALARMV